MAIGQLSGYWQQIINFLIAAGLISFITHKIYDYYKKQLETYNLLILFLLEINRKISRCEGMLDMWNPKRIESNDKEYLTQVVSFANVTTPTFDKGWAMLLDRCSNYKLIDDIAYIYEKFDFVKYNVEKANLTRVDKKKEKGIEQHIQNSIIDSYRWGVAMAFIRNYLLIIFKKYNRIHNGLYRMSYINILSFKIKKIGFKFPDQLGIYGRTYTEMKKTQLKLEEAHLDE